ncbi:MAG TPA: acylase [Anaerolineae bacterium]|nr:acylase [Anaerolineae bacterium]
MTFLWQFLKENRLGVLIGLILLIIVYLNLPQRDDLDRLRSIGEEYDVRILRDEWGVPHIYGDTDADAAFGLAYAHAEDDFATIQDTMVAARGQLAAVYGEEMAPNDYLVQLLRLPEQAQREYDALSAETRAVLDAYADGINYYAARHQTETVAGLFPATGVDVLQGFMHRVPFFFGLDREVIRIFEDDLPMGHSEAEAEGGDHGYYPGETGLYGSNVFAVGPNRAENGSTFLAVNSHQPWSGPVTWYEAHVHSEDGWNAVGGVLPGSPFIVVGHNEHLGWSFTVNNPDLVDIYELEINPDNPNQYMFDGEWRNLEVREAEIDVKVEERFALGVAEEVLWSVYGPTIRRPGGTYSFAYAGMGDGGIVEQFYHMNKAENFTEWYSAMSEGALPMFNVGYADGEGNVFYAYNGMLPIRVDGYDWAGVVPGNSSATMWQGYVPFNQLPQVFNPPSGFIQNANSSPYQTTTGPGNPNADNYAASLGIETTMSNRALRALELFGNDSVIEWEEFVAYKFDTTYAEDSDVRHAVDYIVEAVNGGSSITGQARDILAEWDYTVTAESEGATLAIMTFYFLNKAPGVEMNASELVGGHLPEPLIRSSFQQAAEWLSYNYNSVSVPWGEVNRLVRGDVNLPLGGGPDLLHAIYGDFKPTDDKVKATVGDSYILMANWDEDGEVTSYSVHQYGSSTMHARSPHYADQAPLFAAQELKRVWFTEDAVRDHLSSEYRPGEE